MTKKLVAAVVAVALACMGLCALVGCGATENFTDPDSDGFVFKVGFDAEYPPYGYQADDGSYTGFDIELAQAVCEELGWEFACEPIDWDAKDSLIDSESITCIWNGFTYEGREANYAWSDRYMLNAQVIVTKADSGITDEAGLAGKVVATQRDSAALDVLESDDYAELTGSFKELQQLGDYNSIFMQLESGAVDAVACDLSIFAYQNAAKPGVFSNIITLSSESYAVGFKLGNDALAEQVTAALRALDADGTVEALCEKYADQGISYSNWIL